MDAEVVANRASLEDQAKGIDDAFKKGRREGSTSAEPGPAKYEG